MSRIAILGLGAMGQRIATNLLDAGHELYAWNRSRDACNALVSRGAKSCTTPRDTASNADIVICMVSDDEASRAVWLTQQTGALAGMKPGSIAIECSTLSTAWCRELAEHLMAKDIMLLDAPVVGSRPQAEARKLIQLVGGDSESLNRVHHVLEVNASEIYHAGGTGCGMAMKLAVNALFAIQVAALGELMAFTKSYGIAPGFCADLIGKLPVISPAARGAAMAIASRKYAPLFPIKLVRKDLEYAIESATRYNRDLPATASVLNLYTQAMEAGHGEENIHAIARLFDC